MWRVVLSGLVAAATSVACGASNAPGSELGSGGRMSSSASSIDISSGSATGGAGGAPEPCEKTNEAAKPLPVNMYLLVDRTASMQGEKWNKSVAALKAFVADAKSTGLRVALRFFPYDGCAVKNDTAAECQKALAFCAQPTVSLGELTADGAPKDVQESKLIDAIDAVMPGDETPISIALEGALSWAQEQAKSTPEERVIVVAITDGSPNQCNGSSSYLAGLAETAFKNSSIVTYTLGLPGSDKALLDKIADKGGSQQSTTIVDASTLTATLLKISEKAVACAIGIPKTEGQVVDIEKVNVAYGPKGLENHDVVKLANAQACGDGWFYDDPSKPKKIVLCPKTCNAVQADGTQVVVKVGCKSITPK
jgi:hypothetical protein